VADLQVPGPQAEQVEQAQTHGMPPMQANTHPRDAQWLTVLSDLLNTVLQAHEIPSAARQVMQDLLEKTTQEPETLESWADALLAEREDAVDAASAPFVMAALQVYWTALA